MKTWAHTYTIHTHTYSLSLPYMRLNEKELQVSENTERTLVSRRKQTTEVTLSNTTLDARFGTERVRGSHKMFRPFSSVPELHSSEKKSVHECSYMPTRPQSDTLVRGSGANNHINILYSYLASVLFRSFQILKKYGGHNTSNADVLGCGAHA